MMNIGKQSTLNDLKALKEYLEGKIREVENVNGVVLESSLTPVPLLDFINYPASKLTASSVDVGSDMYPSNGRGVLRGFVSKGGSGYGVSLMIEDAGSSANVFIRTMASGVVSDAIKLLSNSNTITDSNGFIKAA